MKGLPESTGRPFFIPHVLIMILNRTSETTYHRRKLTAIGHRIGSTPIHTMTSLSPKPGVEIMAKLEWEQFGGSVKARAAYRIIRYALTTGRLRPGLRLLDASSGNTGIAYASICAAMDIPLTLCLPENASRERILILKALGVELILTSRLEGTDGAQRVAAALTNDQPERFYYADQYNNPRNWQAHFYTTAKEIVEQTSGRVTHFVAGLGTTGSFTGTARGLKCHDPSIQMTSLQPEWPMHGLEGWKHLETAKVPGIYDPSLADRQVEIDTGEAYDLLRFVARREGLLISPSAAANLLGAKKIADSLSTGTIVTLLADNGEKYSEVLSQIID